MTENSVASEASTIAVLREHIAFLREQLADKNTWHAQALEKEQARAQRLEKERDESRALVEKLRVALAKLHQEVWFHNTDQVESGGYETPEDWLREFEEMLP